MEIEEPFSAINQIKIPPVDIDETHLLITPIRKKYLSYIRNLLTENYVSWCGEMPPQNVLLSAEALELEAAAKAMIVPLYRKEILSMISLIKTYTKNKELFLYSSKVCVRSNDVATQTDDLVQNNQIIINNCDQANNKTICDNSNIRNGTKSNDENIDYLECHEDQVLKDMEELFKGLSNDEIFNEEQLMMIMGEIDDFNNVADKTDVVDEPPIVQSNNEINTPIDQIPSNINNVKVEEKVVNNVNLRPKYVYSKWPCEEYYQKQKLSKKMNELCEKSLKLHSRIKKKFVDLFGYQTDDEETILSPNNSPEFLRSCRERVSCYVVHHMKRFVVKYKVPTYLYRSLAKHLIYKLIDFNQYPDDYETYKFVKEYFRHHPRIRCKADF